MPVGGIEMVGIAPRLFGLVHGGVGLTQQGLAILTVVGVEADADAGAGEDLLPLDQKTVGEDVQHLGGDGGGSLGVDNLLNQDHELIPPQPGHGVLFADDATQPLPRLQQQHVAQGVAQGVVDDFEAIQIEEHHRKPVPVAACVSDGVIEPVEEEGAVGQSGQGVVVGQIIEADFALFAGGDVGEHPHIVGDRSAVIAHHGDDQPFGVDLPRFASMPDLPLPRALFQQLLVHCLIKGFVVVAGMEQCRGLPDGLLGGVAGDVGEGVVDHDDPLIGVGNHDPLQAVLEHPGGQLQLLFLGP